MTEKKTVTDGEGPGVRADRALKRRLQLFQLAYLTLATALAIGLAMGRRDPAAGFPPFTPEAGLAGAILLPLLTLVTMWVSLRMIDEVFRRIILDAWATGLVVTVIGAISWGFLIGGGIVPQPSGTSVLFAVAGSAGVTVLVAAVWLRWRRVGDFGAA